MNDHAPTTESRHGLRRSVLIALLTGMSLWIASSFAIGRSILVASMLRHEQADGLSLAHRMQGLVDAELARLDRTSRDWSAWDETWFFARGEAPEYIARNIYDSVPANLKLTLMAVVGADDTVRLLRASAPTTGQARPAAPEVARLLAPGGAWLEAHQRDRPLAGLVASADGLLAFVAHPIHRSPPATSRESAGTQVFGRLLGDDFIEEARPLLRAELALFNVADGALPGDVAQVLAHSDDADTAVRPLDISRLAGYAVLRDWWGQPVAVLRAISPRSVYADARRAERWLLLASLAIGLLAGTGLYVFMARRVLRPLQALDEAVNGLRDGTSARVPPAAADDEFARLGHSINGLLDELDDQRDAREARDAAQAASRLKGELLARLTAGTQAPLATLRAALAELLTTNSLGTEDRATLEQAWRAAHTVAAALDEMPDFTWAGKAVQPLTPRAVDVRAIVEEAACLVAARSASTDPGVVCRIDPALADAYLGDGLRLRALLHALLFDRPVPAAGGRRLKLEVQLCERGENSDGLAVAGSGLPLPPLSGSEQRLAIEIGGLLTATPDAWRLTLRWPRQSPPTTGPAPGLLAGRHCLLVGRADDERDVLETYLRALGSAVTCRIAVPSTVPDEVDLAVYILDGTDPLPRVGGLPLVAAWPPQVPPPARAPARVDVRRPVRWAEFLAALRRITDLVSTSGNTS